MINVVVDLTCSSLLIEITSIYETNDLLKSPELFTCTEYLKVVFLCHIL